MRRTETRKTAETIIISLIYTTESEIISLIYTTTESVLISSIYTN